MRNKQISVFITIEREIEVFFDCTPASTGARDSLGGIANAGPPLEPDEPASVDFSHTDSTIDLTNQEFEKAQELALKELQDEAEDQDED